MADTTDKRCLEDEENNRLVRLISPISDDYSPSISDKTRAGYFSQDCASQTERSDIINLKEMTNMVGMLVQDLSVLKKSLHFARHVLEADYKSKLEEKGLDLYCRVNDRILDLEKMHEERVRTIRRSFKQQLSDAVVQVANENEKITMDAMERKAMLAEKRKQNEMLNKEKGKAKQQQEAMMLMMKMQMKEQEERAERELEEALMRKLTPSPIESTGEMYELRMMVANLESKVDDMDVDLEDKRNENKQLVREVDDLSEQLEQEREVVKRRNHDLKKVEEELEQQRRDARIQLERQKSDLESEFERKMKKITETMSNDSQRQLNEYKTKQMSKLRNREMTHQRLLDEASKKKEKPQVPDSDKDSLINKLQAIEAKLTAEIVSLRKDLDRANKTWGMKVTIMKQSIHALKDEAFLRASLQKQAAKLHHASVTYASDGPLLVPSDPLPLNKRYRILPPHVVGGEKLGVIPGILSRKDYSDGTDDKSDRTRTNSHPLGKTEPLDSSINNPDLVSVAAQHKDTNRTIEINLKT